MNTKTIAMPSLPSMPSRAKSKPIHPCQCGCGQGTKATWASGHDGRATGWAIRIERGVITMDGVPANERKGAQFMLTRRAEAAKVERTGTEG